MAGSGDIAVRARGVGKEFRIGQLHGGYQLFSERLVESVRSLGRRRSQPPSFWALEDVDFEVRRGETFGIVGHNGAGKSTLLKILSRVTPPTRGEIELNGRVGALLEVGTGFNMELTGRENVFLNGAILGMRRAEIERKFDEIVEFAEVERFIDTPVKRYSSGMYLRLAFAVAAHLEPEILIVDEVLSVGDLAFQEKCLGRMERVAGEGRTVIFVSHNLTAVRSLCERSMLISRGRKLAEGPTDAVLEEYVRGVRSQSATDLSERRDRQGSGRLRFESVRLESAGLSIDSPMTGQDFDVVLRYRAPDGRPVRRASFSLGVYTILGQLMLHLSTTTAGVAVEEAPPEGEVRCRIPRCPLPAGSYTVNVAAEGSGEMLDWVQGALELTVGEGDFFGSGQRPPQGHQSVLIDHSWSVAGAPPGARLAEAGGASPAL